MTRPHTRRRSTRYTRYPCSQLGNGSLAAHGEVHLMLLGSPPDMVRGSPLRKTDSSSPLTWVRRYSACPRAGIHPCCSGLQIQGTANSPTSAALPQAGPVTKLFYFTRKRSNTQYLFKRNCKEEANRTAPLRRRWRHLPSRGGIGRCRIKRLPLRGAGREAD